MLLLALENNRQGFSTVWRTYCYRKRRWEMAQLLCGEENPDRTHLCPGWKKLPMIIRSSNVNTALIAPRVREYPMPKCGCLSVNLFTKARCERVLPQSLWGYPGYSATGSAATRRQEINHQYNGNCAAAVHRLHYAVAAFPAASILSAIILLRISGK